MNKIIAIASSTGGPKALNAIIPQLPEDLQVPVVIVQHMPLNFTKTFSMRLDEMSKVKVVEAADGMKLQSGHVYIAKAGTHLNIIPRGSEHYIRFSDEKLREGVKPCANYMYESLSSCNYDEVIAVILTGMGSDGTIGIEELMKNKKVKVLIQDEKSSVVYGMPGSIVKRQIPHEVVTLDGMARAIINSLEV